MKLLILGDGGHGQVVIEITYLSKQHNKISLLEDKSEKAISGIVKAHSVMPMYKRVDEGKHTMELALLWI